MVALQQNPVSLGVLRDFVRAYRNVLSLNHLPKAIPYGASTTPRMDGSHNHGFVDLKAHLANVASIPELTGDAALLDIISGINSPETGIFSIGCASTRVSTENGVCQSGYVEFAFNSASRVGECSHYFPLFFQFDRALHLNQFGGRVAFDWELQPAMFLDANVEGYSCAVFIGTEYMTSAPDAEAEWQTALTVLALFLSSVRIDEVDRIYGA